MDEVHRRVGFQQVAPDPLPGMGPPRDKQHLQAVPHAVHGDDRAVVGGAELVRPRLHPELEDGGARAVHGKGDAFRTAEDDAHRLQGPAVRRDRDQRAAAPGALRAQILNQKLDLDILADDAVGRCRPDGQPPVAVLLRVAGQQHMHGAHFPGSGGRRRRCVMRLAVGDEEGSGPLAPRHRRPGLAQRAQKRRAAVGPARPCGLDDQRVQMRQEVQPALQRIQGLVRHPGPAAHILASGAVHQDDGRVPLLLPQFRDQGRPQERGDQQRREQQPERAARGAARKGKPRRRQRRRAESADQPPGQHRRKRDVGCVGDHPSRRRRMAGTCTWSAL